MFDFNFVDSYIGSFIQGLRMTLEISILAIIFGTIIGTILYFMKDSKFSILKIKPLKIISVTLIEVIRGTPMLLQIMMVYSGSKMILGLNLSAFIAALVAITLNSSVYIAEVVRAGIESVDIGQMEASRSLGMTKALAIKLIILPQAIKKILPALGNEFVAVIKDSSMGSVIGVAELTFSAKIVQGATYLAMEPLIISGCFYFILTFLLGRGIGCLERRYKVSDLH